MSVAREQSPNNYQFTKGAKSRDQNEHRHAKAALTCEVSKDQELRRICDAKDASARCAEHMECHRLL